MDFLFTEYGGKERPAGKKIEGINESCDADIVTVLFLLQMKVLYNIFSYMCMHAYGIYVCAYLGTYVIHSTALII